MRKLSSSLVVLIALFVFSGCGGGSESGSAEDDSGSSLRYTGNIYSCIYNGTSCTNSESCAVTTATSSGVGTIVCKENLKSSNFSGTLSACYFAGKSCTSSSYCATKTQAGDVGTIKCDK